MNLNEGLFENIKPVQLIGGALSGLFFLVLTVQVLFPDLAIPFVGILVYALTMVDFLCHEMGHFVFGLLGEFIGVLGGTMGQLFLPVICLLLTLRRRQWVRLFRSRWCQNRAVAPPIHSPILAQNLPVRESSPI